MSDVSKTNAELITEARFYESPGHVAAYAEGTLELLRKLADALEAATLEQDSAGDIRRAVRLWSERFIPGDRWDTEDARDLDAALKCVVEANPNRSRARVPVQGEPNDDRTPEFEAIEQELFKHQPLLSMQDGSIRGCKCMDRVFVTKTEDWGTHLAEVFMRLPRPTAPDAATEAKNAWHLSSDVWQARALKAEAERDAALAAVEAVRALHEPFEAGVGRHYCGECSGAAGSGNLRPWPCPTVAALDGAPEPEALELPETGLEVRDGDGDLITTGEHRRVLHQGGYVCDTCVNILGINVRWDRADRMEGHPLPVEGESDEC